MRDADVTLDCGHPPSLHGQHDTGYGTDSAGRRHCYACCAAMDLARVDRGESIAAYVTEDGRRVSTWGGVELGTIVAARSYKTPRSYVSARHWTIRTRVNGRLLWGRTAGRGMLVILRPYKGNAPRWPWYVGAVD